MTVTEWLSEDFRKRLAESETGRLLTYADALEAAAIAAEAVVADIRQGQEVVDFGALRVLLDDELVTRLEDCLAYAGATRRVLEAAIGKERP